MEQSKQDGSAGSACDFRLLCGKLRSVSSNAGNSAKVQAVKTLNRLLQPAYWFYERQLLRAVKDSALPQHIGVIMDGNRRYARRFEVDVKAGHSHGASKAREFLDWCLELRIPHVTIWGFSSENRGRADDEVAHLHELFFEQATQLLDDPRLHRNRVRVRIIGDISDFPDRARSALERIAEATSAYDGMNLNLALGYGGREEIIAAMRSLLSSKARAGESLEQVAESLSATEIGEHLYTAGLPDPDFVIRTSGEVRLSGFLLWQTAYSEFYFCDAFWPDFRKVDFLRAIRSYQARERRYGR